MNILKDDNMNILKKYQKFSENQDFSFFIIFKKVILLFISLISIIYIVIALARIYMTFKGDLILEGKLWEFIRLLGGFILLLALSLVVFIISLRSTFKNKKETELISTLIKNSVLPILALAIFFLGANKIDMIKESILFTEISENEMSDTELFNNIMMGSIFFIVPSILTIIYNIKMFFLEVERSRKLKKEKEYL